MGMRELNLGRCKMDIKLITYLDTDTSIDWWNGNRKRLNEVIERFNKWQTDYRFDQWEMKVVKAMIVSCRKYGEKNNFSDWQFEILDEIEEFIKEYKSDTDDIQ
jgi:hypothetical protein